MSTRRARSRLHLPIPATRLYRVGIVLSLLGALPAIGWVIPKLSQRPELLAIICVSPLVIVMLYRLGRIEYSVLAIVLTAAFVRFSLPTGTESRIVASLLMTLIFIALWLTKMLVVDKRLYLKPSCTNVPLLAFILTTVISYVWSNAFRDSLVVVWRTWPFVQLGGLAVTILLPGAFLLTVNSISEVRWLKLLCWLMVLIGVLALGAYFLQMDVSFLNTGGLFSLWFVSLAYAQALFNKKLGLLLRLILLGLVGAWVYIYFITRVTWLSGWLPPFAAITAISFLRSKRIFLVLVLLVAVYVGLNWDYYTGTVLAAETEESGHTRLAAWEKNWEVTSKHILFGTGPAGYAAYYMSYFPDEAMATHSNYLDIISQFGIVGLFFCLWFFGALAWTGYRLHVRLKGTGDFSEGFVNATLAGCVGSILAMGLGDWMFPFVYTQSIAGFDYAVYGWILLGGMVSLASLVKGRDEQ